MTQAGWSADFGGVEPAANKALPTATYLMRIFKLDWGKIGDNARPENVGKDKLSVTFKVDGGDQDGREFPQQYTFGPEQWGLPRFMQLCVASGKIPESVLEGKEKITPAHVAKMQGALVAVKVVSAPAKVKELDYADDFGNVNRVRGVYHENSDQGKLAKAAITRNPLAPKRA
jgi:hypothetical protein